MTDKPRSVIIAELYNSKEIANALRKMQPSSLREELRQEIFLALCNISDEKFWSIYNNNGANGLRFWLVRSMLNMVYSHKPTDSFYRNFRIKNEPIEPLENLPNVEDDSKQAKEVLFERLENNKKSLTWYENAMLECYVELGFNQTEVSRRTTIPYTSVVKVINVIKKKLST